VPWLTSEYMHTCWQQDAMLVPVSDPAMQWGSAYPSKVIMSSWLFHNPNFPLLSESNLRDKVSSNEGRYR